MTKLNGKVAVITGAASGIGRGTALCLAKEGAAVVAADLNSQGGEQTIGEIAAGGRACHISAHRRFERTGHKGGSGAGRQ